MINQSSTYCNDNNKKNIASKQKAANVWSNCFCCGNTYKRKGKWWQELIHEREKDIQTELLVDSSIQMIEERFSEF